MGVGRSEWDGSAPFADAGAVRRAVDLLPSMVGYWNSDLVNTFANKAFAAYFGLTPDEIRGRHIRDVLGEPAYELNSPHMTAVLTGHEQRFERTLIDAHGLLRTTQSTYIPDGVDEVVGFTELVVDVSDRVEAQRQRDDAERLFRVAMENAPIGKAILDTNGRMLQVNRALCELSGYTSDELLSMSFRDITHPDDLEIADAHMAALVDGPATQIASEKRYIRKDGTTIWVQRNAAIVRGTDDGDVIIAQVQDISRRKAAEEDLAEQAVTDELTGLSNRRRLMSELAEPGSMTDVLGILYIDIDDFKSINDERGHATGDEVLAELGRRLRESTRGSDLSFRVGGDEFVVVVRGAQTLGDVETLGERVRTLLSGRYRITQRGLPDSYLAVTVTVGSSWSADSSAEQVLREADGRMYRRKRRIE